MGKEVASAPSFDSAYRTEYGSPPPALTNTSLERFWGEPVAALCQLTAEETIAPEQQERHRIYARLLIRLIAWYWNGSKYGRNGTYPLSGPPVGPNSPHHDRDYYGHNIAALAVDAKGYILDFDFNHNDLFVSSAEHAEARLVRRLYSLAQISEAWGALSARESRRDVGEEAVPASSVTKSQRRTNLLGVTVYTSLESCAQCSGIMALAAVSDVVYLQTDPGTYWIGRILRNLTSGKYRAPRPISGSDVGLSEFAALDAAYRTFVEEKKVFWVSEAGDPRSDTAITSFLCTGVARQIFVAGGHFDQVPLGSPAYRPFHDRKIKEVTDPHRCSVACALSNEEVKDEAVRFWNYAIDLGARGTPHNL